MSCTPTRCSLGSSQRTGPVSRLLRLTRSIEPETSFAVAESHKFSRHDALISTVFLLGTFEFDLAIDGRLNKNDVIQWVRAPSAFRLTATAVLGSYLNRCNFRAHDFICCTSA
jgi:hypothetical protein